MDKSRQEGNHSGLPVGELKENKHWEGMCGWKGVSPPFAPRGAEVAISINSQKP
jgi:hypothetical protein